MQVNSVGVIGAGTMGNGIAQVFAASGFKVILHDIADEPLQRGLSTIENSLDRMVKKEKISDTDKANTLANIQGVTSPWMNWPMSIWSLKRQVKIWKSRAKYSRNWIASVNQQPFSPPTPPLSR